MAKKTNTEPHQTKAEGFDLVTMRVGKDKYKHVPRCTNCGRIEKGSTENHECQRPSEGK